MPAPANPGSLLRRPAICCALLCAGGVALLAMPQPSRGRNAEREAPPHDRYDVVVYGGTSAGVIAAIQASKLGKSVLLLEPGRHVGGLTSGGLGATDIGNKGAIGGLSRHFYQLLGAHYARDDAWKQQSRGDFRGRRQAGNEAEMWLFEPHVAENTFLRMLADAKVPVRLEQRLDLKDGVITQNGRIDSLKTTGGARIFGRMFIDATYEGDLMALAGVSYTVGREANTTYGESLNGVQSRNAVYHQFTKAVDPYVTPGDPSSGLLPGIAPRLEEAEGQGDHRVQAYCFRMCTTDVPENQWPWVKPADYDPLRHELLLRNFEAGDHRIPWNPILLPNRKTDTNNNYAISTDNIGMNYDYPDGDYETRQRIFKEHLSYQQGLMWTLANHPRVPEQVRAHFQKWKPARDEFRDSAGWPHQLYVREARRMVADYVMTQHDCQGRRQADDSVGLAAYTMDSHHIQRHVKDGRVLNEGDVQVGGFAPYPISYRSICPRKHECRNLLVPVCLAASHIAYGSIRMEPVFMVLGQSAATAACQAIDAQATVQEIDYQKLRSRLLEDRQVLDWTGPRPPAPILSANLDGLVVDNLDAEVVGDWVHAKAMGGFVDAGYLHDGNKNPGEKKVVFRPNVTVAGRYDVRVYYTPAANRAENAAVTIESAEGTQRLSMNQRQASEPGGFRSLGRFRFAAGRGGSVTISNHDANGFVIADAVQLVPAAD